MIYNYLKTAFRNLWKHRFYTSINILGLSSGILCFLLILAFIQDELKYDKFHQNSDRIYRINFDGRLGGNEFITPRVGAPVGPVMKEEFPEVENYVRFRNTGGFVARYEDHSFQEDNVIFADSTLLEVFDFELVNGDATKVLREPNSAIITQTIARKYFGDENPIGKKIRFDEEEDIVIDGVLEDIPKHSHIQKDIFIALSHLEESRSTLWTDMNLSTYLLLAENANVADVIAKLPDFVRRNVGVEIERFLQLTYEEILAAGNSASYSLLPLEDIYLRSTYSEDLGPSSDENYLYIFGAIALIILLLASINFINLATARASTRALEVGVRKVIGAQKTQLIQQFLSESTLLAILSTLTGIIVMYVMIPVFNGIADKDILFSEIWMNPLTIGAALALIVVIGLLAGAYPSFYLTRFIPAQAIRGNSGKNSQANVLRNGLVVFQFAVTTILLVGTITVYQQMQYIQNKRLGYNKQQVLLIDGAYSLGERLDAYKTTLRADPRVDKMAATSYLPTPSERNRSSYFFGDSPGSGDSYVLQYWYVDEDYIPTIEVELAAGRNFRPTDEANTNEVILNETAIAQLSIQGDPIGQKINRISHASAGAGGQNTYEFFEIVGVVKDFHYESFRNEIGPMVMHQGESARYIALRINTNDVQSFITQAEQEWKALAPHLPFNYTFLDEGFSQMYESEIRMSRITTLFAGLSMLIACIGLLGLATFTTMLRQKEISIRKVLGASMSNLFFLLTRDFGSLIGLAFIIAIPLSWYLMRKWLQGFVYAIPITGTSFLFTAGLLILLGLLAVGYQSVRSAQANPATVLKGE